MKRPIVIDALLGEHTDHTPIWLMRQAGRYLPEYRALREKAGSFLDLCFNPDMAAEVTLQPVRRFDVDAAILFSDILVVPHALGQELRFEDGEGPKLGAIGTLRYDENKISAVLETVAKVRASLPADKALIGFAGSPWTVASYMVEGGGGHDFSRIKPMLAGSLREIIDTVTDATIRYLSAQIEAGAQIVQLFESWAGVLDGLSFDTWVIAPNKKIVTAIKDKYPHVPVIGFPRAANTDDLKKFVAKTGVNAVGISQDVDLALAQELQKSVCVQGNLDPALLLQGGPAMTGQALEICNALGHGPFVFNLGHGIIKETNPDHVAQLVETVHGWRP